MEVSIKRIGYKVGTVGWLAAGLQSGSVQLNEGTLKDNGHHGLWLKSDAPKLSQFLAAYDQYNVGDQLPSAASYDTADASESGIRDSIWTDAAWATLMQIAADWCEMCQSERASDQPLTIKPVRTE